MRRVAVGSLVAVLGCYRDAAPTAPPPAKTPARPATFVANTDPLAFLLADA